MKSAIRIVTGVVLGLLLIASAVTALVWPTEPVLNLVGGVLIVMQVAALAIVVNPRARGRIVAGSFLLVSGVLAFWDYWAPEPEYLLSPSSERWWIHPHSVSWEILRNWLANCDDWTTPASGPAAYLTNWQVYHFIEVGVLLTAILGGGIAACLAASVARRFHVTHEAEPRPWFQLGLKTLLLYTLLIGLGLGYAVRERNKHEAIQPAFQRLEDFIWDSGGHPRYFPWFNHLVWLDVPGHIDIVWLDENATEEDFLAVCQLPAVPKVRVSHWSASQAPTALVDQWPRHLRQVRGLRKVQIENLPLRALRAFEGLPLEEITLEDMGEMSDAELLRLGTYSHLKSLSITQFHSIQDSELAGTWGKCLETLPQLQSLTLDGVSFDGDSLTAIGCLHELKHLNLTGIDDEGAEVLGKLTQLETLELPLDVGDRGIAHLHSLQSLTGLVAHGELTDESCAWIAKNRQVRELDLGNAQITDRGVEALMHLKSLERLSLRSSNLTDEGLNKLTTLSQLRYLNVSGKGITDHGLQQLHKLRGLETLALQETSVTQAGIETVDRFPRLGQLYLGDVQIDTASIQRFNAGMKARGRRLELFTGHLN